MSRSKVALLGAAGAIGAALLVTPLVSQTAGQAPPSFSTGYDPLLSEANCAETDSQLALAQRPQPVAPAPAEEVKEVAFLAGIEPSGGGGEGSAAGTDGDIAPVKFAAYYGPTTFPPPKPHQPSTFKALPSFHGPVVGPVGNPFPVVRTNLKLPPHIPSLSSSTGTGSGTGTGNDGGSQDDIVDLDDDSSSKSTIVTFLPPDEATNNQTTPNDNESAVAVPEPASLGLLAFGIGLLAARRRRSA